jgi:hypothetical protein
MLLALDAELPERPVAPATDEDAVETSVLKSANPTTAKADAQATANAPSTKKMEEASKVLVPFMPYSANAVEEPIAANVLVPATESVVCAVEEPTAAQVEVPSPVNTACAVDDPIATTVATPSDTKTA